jgi:uncharacterized protein (DUF697 family)
MRSPLELREIVGLVRQARSPAAPARPVEVSGLLARELVSALAAGGRPGHVRIGTGEGATVLVRVLGGAPTAEDVAVLRRATRALVPIVAVQTAAFGGRVPYVPADCLVEVPPGRGFPIDEIAAAIARAAAGDAVDLAAALPVLTAPVRRGVVRRTAALAAVVAGTPVGGDAHLPVIATAQTRMLEALRRTGGLDVAGGDPQAVARVVGPEIVLPLGVGLAARTLVRRAPRSGALLRAGVAAGATLALGELAVRLADRLGRS